MPPPASVGLHFFFDFVDLLDLMDLLALYQPRANVRLDELAKLMGCPGKLGMDGSAVWQAWQDGRQAEQQQTLRRVTRLDRVCILRGRHVDSHER